MTGDTGAIVWFTGLPASGKSTLARRVQARLIARGKAVVLLDGDEVRDLLGAHTYAPEARGQFYRTLAELAALIAKQGVIVLVAATAPNRRHRGHARALVEPGSFVEVWVSTPREVSEARDPKGLYAQARRDPANELPGVGAAYETPVIPDVTADGGLDDAAAAAIERQLDQIEQRRERLDSSSRRA
jgi:adenylylsulfate kinase